VQGALSEGALRGSGGARPERGSGTHSRAVVRPIAAPPVAAAAAGGSGMTCTVRRKQRSGQAVDPRQDLRPRVSARKPTEGPVVGGTSSARTAACRPARGRLAPNTMASTTAATATGGCRPGRCAPCTECVRPLPGSTHPYTQLARNGAASPSTHTWPSREGRTGRPARTAGAPALRRVAARNRRGRDPQPRRGGDDGEPERRGWTRSDIDPRAELGGPGGTDWA